MRLVQERSSMTSEIGQQTDLGGFAAVINSRLAAEGRVAKAIAVAWVGGGAAIACCLTGLGLLAAFYGYSYMLSVKPAAEQTARALVGALERTQLKTKVSGTMSLAPNSELKLAPGQTVKLAENSIVKLDPNSSVRVIGDLKVDMPQPSKGQLQLDTRSKNEELPFTSYTVFRSVPYASGRVVTGWNFDLADVLRPKSQYCYYTATVKKGASIDYTLAWNGLPQRPSSLDKVDFDDALANCIWFSGV
jgi:hypothetical protein